MVKKKIIEPPFCRVFVVVDSELEACINKQAEDGYLIREIVPLLSEFWSMNKLVFVHGPTLSMVEGACEFNKLAHKKWLSRPVKSKKRGVGFGQ